jgi:ATP-binding cassette, subfamily B, bacterial
MKKHELIQVLRYMKSKLPLYLSASVLAALIQAFCLNIVLAYIMKDAVNAIHDKNWDYILRAVLLAGLSLGIGMFVLPILSYLVQYCTKKTMEDIKLEAFKQVENLTIESLETNHSGDLLSRMTQDVKQIEGIYNNQIPNLLFSIIYGIGAVLSILIMDWRLGLLVILFGGVSILINKRFSLPIRKHANDLQNHKSRLTQKLIDLFEGIPTTKLYQLESLMSEEYEETNEACVRSEDQTIKLQSSIGLIETCFQYIRYFSLLFLGLILIRNHQLSVGSIAAIVHLQGSANYFFSTIGQFISNTQKSLAGASRVFELYKYPVEEDCINNSVSVQKTDDYILFQDVNFGYRNEALFKQLNFSVKRGSVTALVGPSGSGKTSVFKLLLRFYNLQKGLILYEGRDIQTIPIKELRQDIAYVSQENYLFADTIESNIRYGKPSASLEEVIAAAKKAYADEFIMEQPNGYQTLIGEKGSTLSGGQKQRIAIARALLKNAPILLLDEATSALDSESEGMVNQALEELMKGRTTLVIAHQLSTVQHADQLLVFDQGKLVERGNHKELLTNSNGVYQNLYHQLKSK